MSLGQRVATDHQLARLLQIGVVLEEVVEARAQRHLEELDPEERAALDDEIDALLVDARYGPPEGTDGVLYDQLCNEETAYKFYDDLIEAIEASDAEYAIDRADVLETLRAIREEEREGVEDVTEIMERRA